MNETKMSGIIRRFDDLGRIVVPREIRKLLRLHEGDAMEISVAGNSIRLDRYQPLRFREALCGPCLAAFCRNYQLACAICDTEHVLASRVNPEGTHAVAARKGPYPGAGAILLQPWQPDAPAGGR